MIITIVIGQNTIATTTNIVIIDKPINVEINPSTLFNTIFRPSICEFYLNTIGQVSLILACCRGLILEYFHNNSVHLHDYLT